MDKKKAKLMKVELRWCKYTVGAYVAVVILADVLGFLPHHPQDWFIRIPGGILAPIVAPIIYLAEEGSWDDVFISSHVRYLTTSFWSAFLLSLTVDLIAKRGKQK